MAFPTGKFYITENSKTTDLHDLCENDACGALTTYSNYKNNGSTIKLPAKSGLSTDVSVSYYDKSTKITFPTIGTLPYFSSSSISYSFYYEGAIPNDITTYKKGHVIKIVRGSDFQIYVDNVLYTTLKASKFYEEVLPSNVLFYIQAAGAQGGGRQFSGASGGGSGAFYYGLLNMKKHNTVTVILGKAGERLGSSSSSQESYIIIGTTIASDPYIRIYPGGYDGSTRNLQSAGICSLWSTQSLVTIKDLPTTGTIISAPDAEIITGTSPMLWESRNSGKSGGDAMKNGTNMSRSGISYLNRTISVMSAKGGTSGADLQGGGGAASSCVASVGTYSGGDGGIQNTVGGDAKTFGAGGGGGGGVSSGTADALGGNGGAALLTIWFGYKYK